MTIYLNEILMETEDRLVLLITSGRKLELSKLVKVESNERYRCDLCAMTGDKGVQCSAYVCVGSSRYLRLCNLHKFKLNESKYYYFRKNYTKMTIKDKYSMTLFESRKILKFIRY